MAREMAEQPARLRQLIERFDAIGESARAVAPAPLNGITIVARGSSDHAAVYGRYLLEAATGKPVSLAAPSLHTLYGVEIDYSGQLVIAVSQSGATPEIVRTLDALQNGGGRGLAITNDPESALAKTAGEAVALQMGKERAVPATKTVTGQLTAFAIIASALGRVPFTRGELDAVPDSVKEVLDDSGPVAAATEALVGASQLIIVARGYLYAAALETALKIKETCSLLADGYSAADLRHGPIAAVTRGLPVVALCAPGPAFSDIASLVDELRARGASVLVVGTGERADVPLPGEVPEPLTPILAVVRGQQLAHGLALRLGYDPDRPKGLTKVTRRDVRNIARGSAANSSSRSNSRLPGSQRPSAAPAPPAQRLGRPRALAQPQRTTRSTRCRPPPQQARLSCRRPRSRRGQLRADLRRLPRRPGGNAPALPRDASARNLARDRRDRFSPAASRSPNHGDHGGRGSECNPLRPGANQTRGADLVDDFGPAARTAARTGPQPRGIHLSSRVWLLSLGAAASSSARARALALASAARASSPSRAAPTIGSLGATRTRAFGATS